MSLFFTQQKKNLQHKQGFTLVEVLVSVTLFTVVAVVGITAVIVAKSSYEKNQAIKSTSDSLMFIVEDISRTARLGNFYRCINISGTPSINLNETIEEPMDSLPGQNCEGVAYEPFWDAEVGDPEDQIIYVFAESDDGVGALFTRSVDDQDVGGAVVPIVGEHFQRMTPVNLDIDLERSGFDVIASEDFVSQPRMIVRIHGTITDRDQTTELSLQTTISQRAIRVEP
jgi:prepilin-type N-terminal cleavage/methylation domain-containing protein